MPPDPFTIFLDENHCNNRRLLQTLQDAGVPFVRHLDKFARGTQDEVWLPSVGQNGWALLTKDKRIRYRTNERLAVRRYRIRMFYFTTNELNGTQMAERSRKRCQRCDVSTIGKTRHTAQRLLVLVKFT
jgi:hypothetical protein